MQIEVVKATIEQKPVLHNLLELYAYDFTEFCDFDIGDDGFIARMVAYPKLKKGFVIMINRDHAFNFIDEITNGIADTYNMPGFKKVIKEDD